MASTKSTQAASREPMSLSFAIEGIGSKQAADIEPKSLPANTGGVGLVNR